MAIYGQTVDIELRIRSHVQALRACASAQLREADSQELAANENLEALRVLKSILDAIDEQGDL